MSTTESAGSPERAENTGSDRPTLTVRAAQAFVAYREGDPSLLPAVVQDLTPLLWHVARSQQLGAQAAEDVVQYAWLQLVEGADRIQDPQSVVKWLMTTTRREAWRVSRSVGREDSHADPLEQADSEQTRRTGTADPVAERVLAGHEHEVLWRTVSALSERCRYLLRVIAFAERPDYAAIASALGMPVGSIGPTRGRCLAALRTALALDPAYEMDTRHDTRR